MDYLTGKLPDQTEVQIRTWIRPDSKTYHDQHITFGRTSLYNWQEKRHQWRNWRVVQTSSGVYLCQRTIFWTC